MANLKPLNDRVLIQRIDAENKTPGGILIPDNAKEKPVEGIVVSVGPGRLLENGKLQTPEVKAGDKILFGKWGGTEISLDGKEYLIIKEDEILAIFQ